jgi:hypothetical protein
MLTASDVAPRGSSPPQRELLTSARQGGRLSLGRLRRDDPELLLTPIKPNYDFIFIDNSPGKAMLALKLGRRVVTTASQQSLGSYPGNVV